MRLVYSQSLYRPKVTTLYALNVPTGEPQVCRYDDGTGDELAVPLGTTAFVSGATMFNILPPALKSLAVRSKVKYAPHPYVWMAPAHAMSTGLGIESEGLELPLSELPPWEEDKIKIFPVVCKRSLYAVALELMFIPYVDSSGRTPLLVACTSRFTRAVHLP